METSTFWEDSHQHVKFERESSEPRPLKEEQSIFRYCDGNLNFATVATSEDDECGGGYHKKKVSRDPMSHRIIEKRRRDRMNNCLADLSRLIPADYLKKGRGRIEKTEIIEMAIKHMKHLQEHACRQIDSCEFAQLQNQDDVTEQHSSGGPIVIEHYRLGYQECLSEAMHFLVEVEGFFAGDPLCVQLINHLQKHCDRIVKGDRLNFSRTQLGETTSTSSNSSGGGGWQHCLSVGSNVPSRSSGLSSGSPTSGSCSDSGRTENKDSGVASSNAVTPNFTGTLSGSEATDDRGCEDGSSQLREMLTNSNLTTLENATTISRVPQILTPLTVANGLSGNNSSTDSGSSAAALYKFKNNIKQRFTAEHLDESVSGNGDHNFTINMKRKRCSEQSHELVPRNALKRRDSETCSIPSSPPSPPKYPPPSPSPDLTQTPPPSLPPLLRSNTSFGVPIFALHSKGSFYIPLTLDADILTPYLSAIGFGSDANLSTVSSSVVLHPVTISVNFQQTNHHRNQLTKQPAVSWKSESNGFLPSSKWSSVFSPERN